MLIKGYLNQIRTPVSMPLSKKIVYSVFVLLAGVLLGVVSKVLDETASNLLPPFLQSLDLGNFLSRMGFWIFCGILISIYSKTSIRAALNVFLFFMGMVSSYYFYTVIIAGFYPKAYMMIWIAMTLLAPLLAIVCWYAKGNGSISVCISALIVMIMTRQAFAFGFWYLDIRYILELILWSLTLFVLFQATKQMIKVTIIGLVFFFISSPINLFWGML